MNTIVNPLRKLPGRVNTFIGNIETINLERRMMRQGFACNGFDNHVHDLPYDHLDNRAGFEHKFL